MFNFLKIFFNPTFLQKIDQHLLVNYPTIWETKVHYTIFYLLVWGNALFFGLGYYQIAILGGNFGNVLLLKTELEYIPLSVFLLLLTSLSLYLYYQTTIYNFIKNYNLNQLSMRFLMMFVIACSTLISIYFFTFGNFVSVKVYFPHIEKLNTQIAEMQKMMLVEHFMVITTYTKDRKMYYEMLEKSHLGKNKLNNINHISKLKDIMLPFQEKLNLIRKQIFSEKHEFLANNHKHFLANNSEQFSDSLMVRLNADSILIAQHIKKYFKNEGFIGKFFREIDFLDIGMRTTHENFINEIPEIENILLQYKTKKRDNSVITEGNSQENSYFQNMLFVSAFLKDSFFSDTIVNNYPCYSDFGKFLFGENCITCKSRHGELNNNAKEFLKIAEFLCDEQQFNKFVLRHKITHQLTDKNVPLASKNIWACIVVDFSFLLFLTAIFSIGKVYNFKNSFFVVIYISILLGVLGYSEETFSSMEPVFFSTSVTSIISLGFLMYILAKNRISKNFAIANTNFLLIQFMVILGGICTTNNTLYFILGNLMAIGLFIGIFIVVLAYNNYLKKKS